MGTMGSCGWAVRGALLQSTFIALFYMCAGGFSSHCTLVVLVSSFQLSVLHREHARSRMVGRHSPSSKKGTQKMAVDENDGCSFDEDLIRALDLRPVIQQVAAHCGTHRGRQALLRLVRADDGQQQQQSRSRRSFVGKNSGAGSAESRRKQRLLDALDGGAEEETSRTHVVAEDKKRVVICSIPTSVEECLQEQRNVAQAYDAIQANCIPPLYPADSGPMDVLTTVTTDDDEWLGFSLASFDDNHWTLEHILQAEQVVGKILNVYEWSRQDSVAELCRVLGWTDVAAEQQLRHVHNEIREAVEIVRVRSLMDPSARYSFRFGLRTSKFPVLGVLKERERDLCERQRSATGQRAQSLARDVSNIQEEIAAKEQAIRWGLVQIIHSARREIDYSLDVLARLDVLFAKAAFGVRVEGKPAKTSLEHTGTIRVRNFVHPLLLLSTQRTSAAVPVPIDLELGSQSTNRALVISGPNGGGKTLSMKSFALVCVLSKLGIPITGESVEVDFFDEILTSVGDLQNVESGESTFTAQLNRFSALIDKVGRDPEKSYLVLLDELGGGTEENAGGAIGQAVLEKLLETESCRVVATTHSPRLKTLSFYSTDIECAAVLLENKNSEEGSAYQRPSYKLQYGCIGESYAFGAASRCNPPLPDGVLERAAALLGTSRSEGLQKDEDDGAENGMYMRALTDSLERRLQLAKEAVLETENRAKDTASIQRAMLSLATAYDVHLEKLERRVEHCYVALQQQTEDSQIVLLGETLAELRTVQKQVKSEKELLRERGLKRLPYDYSLSLGENLVIVDENSEWNGTTGTVVSSDLLPEKARRNLAEDDIAVELGLWFGSPDGDLVASDPSVSPRNIHSFQRHQLAVWDYESVWDENDAGSTVYAADSKSVQDSKRRLSSLLSTLKTQEALPSRSKDGATAPTTKSSSFTSSHERKAAGKRKKKKRR